MDTKTVSIIIRTIGRDSIKRAVESVARQTYPHIQLVVVNDSSSDLEWIKGLKSGSITEIKLVNTGGGRGRCRAANIGLENADGEYLLFLDDDDWIAKEHIEKLEKALCADSKHILSYSPCAIVDEFENLVSVFDFDIDSRHILAGNYIPIHSALFSRRAIVHGCKFDEQLSIYEDWDFWIQLYRLGSFVYVPSISAYYFIGSSGVANSDAQKIDIAKKAKVVILKKWMNSLTDDEIIFLSQETEKSRLLDRVISQNITIRAENEKLKEQLQTILESNSWRITKPLRDISQKLNYKSKIIKIKNKINSTIKDMIRRFEKGSTYNGKIIYETPFKAKGGRYICFFSHFDKDGVIDDYVVYYLKELKKIGCDIVFISTATKINQNETNKIEDVCSKIIIKENIGYDFGAWSTAFGLLGREIINYDNIILCNDSVYAPLTSMSKMFETMIKRKLAAWSITDSYEVSYHLQSYFLVFDKNLARDVDFLNFWNNYRAYKHKRNIVEKYEIGISRFLLKKGYSIGAYCEAKKITSTRTNITHTYWRELITTYGCPAIKIELIRDNPLGVDISDLEQILSKYTAYDFSLIQKHINRVRQKNL